jgi:hypothetical protein
MTYSPLSPSALSVTKHEDYFHLAWTNKDEYPEGINIMRKVNSGNYELLDTVYYPTATYDDHDVSQCVYYSYYVTSTGDDEFGNPYGPSNYSLNNALTIPAPTGPHAAKVTGDDSIDFSWTNNDDAYDYVRVAWRKGTASWSTTASTFRAAVNVPGLSQGMRYALEVRAEDPIGGISTYSATAGAVVDVIPPSGLTVVGDSVLDTQMDLSWDIESTGQSGFDIYVSEGTGASAYVWSKLVGASATGGTVGGLTPTEYYSFKIRAKVGATAGSWSGTAGAIAGSPPEAPQGLSLAASGPFAMDLSWTPTGTGYDGFYIYRSLDGVSWGLPVTGVTAGATGYHDFGLVSYTQYWYIVSSYNDSGEADSTAASGPTDNDTNAPTGLALTVLSDSRIRLRFSNNSDDVDSHRIIYRKSTEAYGVVDQTTFNAPATGGVQGNLEEGTKYYFKVRDYFSGDYSSYSGETGATTLAGGTATNRRNETYFAFGNVLCLTTDTPQNVRDMDRVWTSKPTDFSEQDPEALGRFKTVEKVVLEYEDLYSNTPVMVSLSTDQGVTWTDAVAQGTASVSSARYITASVQAGTGPAEVAHFFNVGTGDNAPKSAEFLFVPASSKYFQVRVRSFDRDTNFAWTGLYVFYKLRGPYFEA